MFPCPAPLFKLHNLHLVEVVKKLVEYKINETHVKAIRSAKMEKSRLVSPISYGMKTCSRSCIKHNDFFSLPDTGARLMSTWNYPKQSPPRARCVSKW